MKDEMNAALFIETLRKGRADWEGLLAQVPADQMTEPGAAGTWTLKDIIAHVTWHERQMVGLLQGRTLANASDLWLLPQDERNSAVYEQNRDRPLAEVLEEAQKVYGEVLELVATLSDDELHHPSRFEGMPAEWVPWKIIASNTYRHYQMHTPDIQAWTESTTRAD